MKKLYAMSRLAQAMYRWKNLAISLPVFYGPESLYVPYLGRRGPVTFTGTPVEVISQMRRWQKGLEP
jgi:hypothetical protein